MSRERNGRGGVGGRGKRAVCQADLSLPSLRPWLLEK